MATSYAGPAPITARQLEDCPEYDAYKPRNSGCRMCRKGKFSHCRYPYRPGKSRRENRRFKVKKLV